MHACFFKTSADFTKTEYTEKSLTRVEKSFDTFKETKGVTNDSRWNNYIQSKKKILRNSAVTFSSEWSILASFSSSVSVWFRLTAHINRIYNCFRHTAQHPLNLEQQTDTVSDERVNIMKLLAEDRYFIKKRCNDCEY